MSMAAGLQGFAGNGKASQCGKEVGGPDRYCALNVFFAEGIFAFGANVFRKLLPGGRSFMFFIHIF